MRLIEQGVKFLHVPVQQRRAYQRMLADRLNRVFHDSNTVCSERARIIRAACAQVIEDVLLFPANAATIAGVCEISKQFARWSTEHPEQFAYLLDMSGHDYFTATHMVNVGVGCCLLANELLPGHLDLLEAMVQGGLLHDIGKRGVPEEILNKEGNLAPSEWETVRTHPFNGFTELNTHSSVPEAVLEMVRDHHERPDGRGYPNGVGGDDLSVAARLCAVVDAYDAIVTARPYRGPTPPEETLGIMQQGAGAQFDRRVLEAWIRIVERLIDEDPERVSGFACPSLPQSLADLLQSAPATVTDDDSADVPSLTEDQRRRHPRFPCNAPVRARFVWQGKRCPVPPDEWFTPRLVDISRGGMQLQTPWPLSRNDVLEVEVEVEAPTGSGPSVRQRARVAWVRQVQHNQWAAGLCFLGRA
jgi:HD-GYP domain-containing protein (c-di-GMP phosphodiesterase class II)